MKATIEHVSTAGVIEGVPVRWWHATTTSGVRIVIVVAEADAAELQAEMVGHPDYDRPATISLRELLTSRSRPA